MENGSKKERMGKVGKFCWNIFLTECVCACRRLFGCNYLCSIVAVVVGYLFRFQVCFSFVPPSGKFFNLTKVESYLLCNKFFGYRYLYL